MATTFDELKTFVNTHFPNNNSGQIREFDLRSAFLLLIEIQSLQNYLLSSTLSPEQTAAVEKFVTTRVTSNVKGEAIPSTIPTAYVGTPIYERYIAYTAGTYVNFNGIVVSSVDLVGNIVFLEVTNGVAKKIIKPLEQAAAVAAKYDKAGGQISGAVSIGNPLPSTDQFNVFNKIRMLNDGSDSVIIGGSIISAGAKFRQLYEDYNWIVPTGNAGMIGMYADIYLHQIANAFSTVVANESYANMSCASGVTNDGRQIGYLGGCMVMSDHQGTLENLSGAQIINRIRPGAAGAVGSWSGVQGGITAYDLNTTAIQEFRAFESLTYDLRGATIVDNYGLYLNPSKRTGVTRGWGVYQLSKLDVNHFAGRVRIGYELSVDIPETDLGLDMIGGFKCSEGISGASMSVTQNINQNKLNGNSEAYQNYLVDGVVRWSQLFSGGESGGISGGNIGLYRYSDSGEYLGEAYSISRETGKFSIGEQLEAKSVKIKNSTLNPEPEGGTLEYDGIDLYFVNGSGVRKKIAMV